MNSQENRDIQYKSFLNDYYIYLPSILALSEENIVCYHLELKKLRIEKCTENKEVEGMYENEVLRNEEVGKRSFSKCLPVSSKWMFFKLSELFPLEEFNFIS